MRLERLSPCKVNFLLNILGKRADGFHELETLFHPVALNDELSLRREGNGIRLTCNNPALPTDAGNLVYRAAQKFLEAARISEGVLIHLEKRVPLAAGLGGGSSNAAVTLLGLNELFGQPLAQKELVELAVKLGSDIPFFLQAQAALATGRGEKISPLGFFTALRGVAALLIYPGFGISTVWAYQQLPRFPAALSGRPGRAAEVISLLQTADLATAGAAFYNSLEAPALQKYPLLALFQEFLRAQGAAATLMSGSGSTTFALLPGESAAAQLAEQFKHQFGTTCWTAVVPL